MALETGTYISDLVSSNPPQSDSLTQAAGHLRLIKATLLATFPSITGAVTKTHTQINDTVATVEAAQFVPAGNVSYTARSTAPTGYLVCDGSAVSRTTYSGLFTAIGTTFGIGDGSTTFNLPDIQDRTIRGKGTTYTTLGGTGGAESVTLTTTELPAHTHGTSAITVSGTAASNGAHTHTFSGTTDTDGAHTHNLNNETSVLRNTGSGVAHGTGSNSNKTSTITMDSAGDHTHTFSGTTASNGAHTHTVSGTLTGSTDSAGTGSAFSIVNSYITLIPIIKT